MVDAVVWIVVADAPHEADAAVTPEVTQRVLAVRAVLARRQQTTLVDVDVTVTSRPAVDAVACVVARW